MIHCIQCIIVFVRYLDREKTHSQKMKHTLKGSLYMLQVTDVLIKEERRLAQQP